MKKSKNVLILLVCLVIIAGLALLTVFGVGSTPLDARNIKLGLDLNGGVSITYQAVDGSNPTKDQMQGTLAVIQRRLDAQGYTEANAYLDGDTRIRVEIPGVKDASQAVEEIGKTAMLRFVGIDWSQVIAQGLDKNYYDQYGEALKKQMEDNGQDTSTLTDDTIQSDAAQYFQSYPADAITQFPQLLQDADPVQAGHHPVQNDAVVVAGLDIVDGVQTVAGHVHRVAGALQERAHGAGQIAVVFGKQQFHIASLREPV